jgi:hypothetical protein
VNFGDLLASEQRWWRPDNGALILWKSRDELLQKLRPAGDGLPRDRSELHPAEVWLRLLGLDILVRCTHPETARQVGAYFSSASLPTPVRSPDCVVECDWPQAGRYLFRARPAMAPELLEGVRVQFPGDPRPLPWRGHQPPIPPIGSAILRDRFIGLHAAACMHPSGKVVVFAGDRRSGKTTTAVHLTTRYGWTLLTDETVFLARRTRIIEPFARSIGLAARIDQAANRPPEKLFVPAEEVVSRIAGEPAVASHLVLLEPDAGSGPPRLEPIRPTEALTALLPHHLDVGTSADESLVTLMQFTENCPAALFRYPAPEDLLALPALLQDTWSLTAERDETLRSPDSLFHAEMDLA